MRVCFDLDNTLCAGKPYVDAKPLPGAAALLQSLKDEGHVIIIYTARGMGRSNGSTSIALANLGKLTFDQLTRWGFEYDEIVFGKPAADVYIDDKALNVIDLEQVKEKICDLQECAEKYSGYGLSFSSSV